jgi:rSAM/selenodomain-associated transferase 2
MATLDQRTRARYTAGVLSAIIPTLGECAALPGLLARLRAEVDEVIVADGGSTDGTIAAAEAGGARVVRAPRGRGPQLNAGAAVATGRILWFLHADTRVPAGAGVAVRASRTAWGCFAVRVDSRDLRLRWCGRWMTERARRTGSCTGDMGMWFHRPIFEALGGFPPLPAFEDLELSERARCRHPWSVLGPPLGTSARRWEREGTTRTILRMWALRAAWRAGVDPQRLGRAYASSPRSSES